MTLNEQLIEATIDAADAWDDPRLIERATASAMTREAVAADMKHLTPEQLEVWLASRKEVGAAINIETCEWRWGYAYACDPYGVDPDSPKELRQLGREYYVRSPTSNGWISLHDLPSEKAHALYDRIKCEANTDMRKH